jgi:hypothetical protein
MTTYPPEEARGRGRRTPGNVPENETRPRPVSHV